MTGTVQVSRISATITAGVVQISRITATIPAGPAAGEYAYIGGTWVPAPAYVYTGEGDGVDGSPAGWVRASMFAT